WTMRFVAAQKRRRLHRRRSVRWCLSCRRRRSARFSASCVTRNGGVAAAGLSTRTRPHVVSRFSRTYNRRKSCGPFLDREEFYGEGGASTDGCACSPKSTLVKG